MQVLHVNNSRIMVKFCTKVAHDKPIPPTKQNSKISTDVIDNDVIMLKLEPFLHQSIPSLSIPPGDPRGFAHSQCPRGQVFAQLSLPGGRGFELEKFYTVLKEKCRNFSICFKETGQLEKQVFLCCFISDSIFAKQNMSTVFLITWTIFSHFGHFDKIFKSPMGHFCSR